MQKLVGAGQHGQRTSCCYLYYLTSDDAVDILKWPVALILRSVLKWASSDKQVIIQAEGNEVFLHKIDLCCHWVRRNLLDPFTVSSDHGSDRCGLWSCHTSIDNTRTFLELFFNSADSSYPLVDGNSSFIVSFLLAGYQVTVLGDYFKYISIWRYLRKKILQYWGVK